jgi:chitinase
MHLSTFFSLAAAATVAFAASVDTKPRFIVYYEQGRMISVTDKAPTAGITHVISAFASSSIFASEPGGHYTPFHRPEHLRTLFDEGAKMCLAVGGWGDDEGFRKAVSTAKNREIFAANVAATLNEYGYDCVGTLDLVSG